MDIPTLITLGGAVMGVLIWLGRVLIKATKAATELSARMKEFDKTLRTLTHEKMDREEFNHWADRLGDQNPAMRIPKIPA